MSYSVNIAGMFAYECLSCTLISEIQYLWQAFFIEYHNKKNVNKINNQYIVYTNSGIGKDSNKAGPLIIGTLIVT